MAPTEEELAAAKKYMIGSYAINNLDSSNGIAGTMVELQLDDLGIDYVAAAQGRDRQGHGDARQVKAAARKPAVDGAGGDGRRPVRTGGGKG